MTRFAAHLILWTGFSLVVTSTDCGAGVPAKVLPPGAFSSTAVAAPPVDNAAFVPGSDAKNAAEFAGVLVSEQASMLIAPELKSPLIGGRDARLMPAMRIEFFTHEGALVPVERGEMLSEQGLVTTPSYWSVIAQPGRVWREPGDGEWSRAAFPIMLVNDTENDAHQGLATFLFRSGEVTTLRFQFVEQTAPYLLHQHIVASGLARMRLEPGDTKRLAQRKAQFAAEIAERLPARPWSELERQVPAGALEGFGGPVVPQWRVTCALVRDGVLYYQEVPTPFGPYPYPLEMRFGVRSVIKSVAAPLALLRLAKLYGPDVLNLKVGAYVKGLPEKFDRIRFVDLANMASGFGGTGTFKTQPNDGFDGYLEGDYDGWYTAPTAEEKIRRLAAMKSYPWDPGTVWRYRDQDFFLLGVAIDAYLKSMRGPRADAWRFLEEEVFAPIGIRHAPVVRTREALGRRGVAWFNAGYYPTLDDLAKIALLYQTHGARGKQQILDRQLTEDLLAARGAIDKTGDRSIDPTSALRPDAALYRMGFHFTAYEGSLSGVHFQLPTMQGSGENEVILFPNGLVSIRIAKAAEVPEGETAKAGDPLATPRAVDRIAPF